MKLIGETFGCAILDTGCSTSVCSQIWLDEYLETLTEEERAKVKYTQSKTLFRFGDSKLYESKERVKIPANIAGIDFVINTDIIDAEIPLLLSKDAMKKAGVIINLKNDEVKMFGKKINVFLTKVGHYCVTLNKKVYLGRLETAIPHRVLIANIEKLESLTKKERRKVAMKWHKQFSHCDGYRLCKLLISAGVDDTEMLKIVDKIKNECKTCSKYGRKPPKPIVTLPRANDFNDSVAMDLKFFGGKMVLHIIDHFTRYSAACVIPSKHRNVIITSVLKFWITIFGTPKQFLCDMGREFNNDDYREMGEKLNTTVKSTAAESPWSNGVNERHNGILGEMVTKTMEDSKCSLEVAVAWAVSAKNSLSNVNGYSPNQLVFGRNPNFPCVLTDKLPALNSHCSSKVLRDNLNALHAAREAFVKNEASEKLRIALRKKTRNCTSKNFVNGDSVYYKKNADTLAWRGPAKVIGIDGACVVVRHGATITTVPPCRLRLENSEFITNDHNTMANEGERHVPPLVEEIDGDDGDDGDDDDDDDDDNDIETSDNSVDVQASEHEQQQQQQQQQQQPSNQLNSTIALGASNSSANINCPGKVELPKLNSTVMVRSNGENEWKRLRIISNGGKKTGKYKNHLNVLDVEKDETECVDWIKMSDWKNIEEEILIAEEPNKEDVLAAKFDEIDKWKSFDVYEEVTNDGQKAISTRWVCTKKENNIKARLVARGYEDDCSSDKTDSPTVDKGNLRVLFTIAASKEWRINFLDVQSAFLQGEELSRVIHLRPPVEAHTDKLWLLKKTVYGLKIASRKWYNRICNALLSLNVKRSRYDAALFYWYKDEKLQGVLGGHVDDFFWVGTEEFEVQVIDKICSTFKISATARDNFPFLGLQLKQTADSIIVEQYAYTDDLKCIQIEDSRNKERPLNIDEQAALETAIGQLSWLSHQTRPDISFDVCQLSAIKKNATVKHLLYANKTIRKVKNSEVHLKFPCLNNIDAAKIIVYSDASFKNLPECGSQGAHIVLLCDSDGRCAPIQWQSKKIKRVVKSTLAAECLALQDGVDNAFYIKTVIQELLKIDMEIHCFVDNNSLVDNVHSSTNVKEDKRLVLDMCALKEMMEKKEVHSICWVSANGQISDVMTKCGASPLTLQRVLCSGRMCEIQ